MSEKIDDFDRKILTGLMENSRQTADQMSEYVGLSPAATQRRMKRLRDDGFIEKEVAVPSGKATGEHMTFLVQVAMTYDKPSLFPDFRWQVQSMPEVQQCFYVTGEYDFVMIITARDMVHFEEFCQKLFFGNCCVNRFHTTVTYSTVKQSLQVPLAESE